MANEQRLIDADALVDKLEGLKSALYGWEDYNTGIDSAVYQAENAPAVDAVEVVRCKDCACYEETCPGFGYCYHWDYEQGMSPNQVEQDDFCSYGERRTE